MATIRPNDLPPAASVPSGAAIPIDTGSAVEKATPSQIVDSAIPLASQAEAEAGTDNARRMTPLRVKQAIEALGVGAEAVRALDPGDGTINFAAMTGTDSEKMTAALTAAGALADTNGVRIAYGEGTVSLAGDFLMHRSTELDFGRALVNHNPSDVSLNFGKGLTAAGATVGEADLRGGRHVIYGAGKTLAHFEHGGFHMVRDMRVSLESANQTAFYVKASANLTLMGPYNSSMSGLQIRGRGLAGQRGIVFEGQPVVGSLTPNRWILTDITDIASVAGGMDIRGADGMTVQGVNFEACTDYAIRFGEGNRSYAGTITTGGSSGVITDTGIVALDFDNVATVMVLTGPNAGHSKRIWYRSGDTIYFLERWPAEFTAGDTFVLTEGKARGISVSGVNIEQNNPTDASVVFKAGALGCQVETVMFTQIGGNLMRREVEDDTNWVGKRRETIWFRGDVAAGDGAVRLGPGADWTRGGHFVSENCYIDAVEMVTTFRGFGDAGSLEAIAKVSGTSVGAGLRPVANANLGSRHKRVRKTLANADMISPGGNIAVEIVRTASAFEHVQVGVTLVYI